MGKIQKVGSIESCLFNNRQLFITRESRTKHQAKGGNLGKKILFLTLCTLLLTFSLSEAFGGERVILKTQAGEELVVEDIKEIGDKFTFIDEQGHPRQMKKSETYGIMVFPNEEALKEYLKKNIGK